MVASVAGQVSAANAARDVVIAQFLGRMALRLHDRGDALTSPQAASDYLRLKMAERDDEMFFAFAVSDDQGTACRIDLGACIEIGG